MAADPGRHHYGLHAVDLIHRGAAELADRFDHVVALSDRYRVEHFRRDGTVLRIERDFPPEEWNIYCFQFSDGDNWGEDSDACLKLLKEKRYRKS